METSTVVTQAIAEVHRCTARLIEIEAAVRAVQPVRDRAVIMYFYRHKTPCMGCPHPLWKQWRHHPKHAAHRWSAHHLQAPLRHLPRRADCAGLRPLVAEAVALQRYRSRLIHHLGALTSVLRENAR